MDAFDAIFDQKQATPEPATPPAEAPPADAVPPAEEAAAVAAVEEAPKVDPAPEPAPAPQEKGDKFVPLAAMLDERDKRKALEAKLAEYEAQRTQPETAIPDPYDDPAGYNAFISTALQNQTLAVKFDLSEEMAKQAHGDDAVETAKEWALQRAASDPAFKQQMMQARHPIDWAVRQHKQAEDLELYQRDPVAFARAVLERSGQMPAPDATVGAVPAVGQQPQAPRPAAPPRSIAGAPSGGNTRAVATGPLTSVDAVFAR